MSSRILVTGANGFTGSHLCRYLAEQGASVRGLVYGPDGAPPVRDDRVEYVEGDLRDGASLERALQGIEIVHHVGALFRPTAVSRADFYAVNADGTADLVQRAARLGVRRFVHCSTVGVYGNPEELPASEESPLAPADPYQESKLAGELEARRLSIELGLPLTVLRPAGIYGPGERRFLPLARLVARGRFVMFGTGDVYYHFVHVSDLCRAFAFAAEHEAAPGGVYNVADAQPIRLRDVVALYAETLGVRTPSLRLPLFTLDAATAVCEAACRPFGIAPPLHRRRAAWFHHSRAFATERIQVELGFEPKVDPREGLAEMVRSYRDAGWLS